jgi:hypothetical protein
MSTVYPIKPSPRRSPDSENRGWAKLMIKTHLRDGQWHPSQPILDLARDRGIGHSTVLAAAKALGVEKKNSGHQGQWTWRLPSRSRVLHSINPLTDSEESIDRAEESWLRLPDDEPIDEEVEEDPHAMTKGDGRRPACSISPSPSDWPSCRRGVCRTTNCRSMRNTTRPT